MGLEFVELVMAIEDEFGIKVEDRSMPDLFVLWDLHAYIVQALKNAGKSPDEEQVWQRLKRVIVDELRIHPDEVTRSAHLMLDLGLD